MEQRGSLSAEVLRQGVEINAVVKNEAHSLHKV